MTLSIIPLGQRIKWNPGHYLQTDNRNGNSVATGGNGRNLAEIQILATTGTGGGWAGSKWLGYMPYYLWSLVEPTSQQFNFAGVVADFNDLQQNCPGARMCPVFLYAAYSGGSFNTSSTPPIPADMLSSSAYGASPLAGSYGWWLSGYNSGTSGWSVTAAAIWRSAVYNRWIAMLQAMANTSFVTNYGPYAGQTFTFNTHPLIEAVYDGTENSWNFFSGPDPAPDWSASAQNAGIEAEMLQVPQAFTQTSFGTFQSYGNATSFPDPNLPGVIAYAAQNRNVLSNADVFPKGISQVSAQEIYCGNVWNGSAWVSGGTDERGIMAYHGTIQPADYNNNPSVTVSQIFATCQTLKATHILWTCWDESTGTPGTFVPTYLTPFINANPVPSTAYPTNYPGSVSATVGSIAAFRLLAQSGNAPYTWSLGTVTGTNTWYVTADGWLYGPPTTAETDTVSVTVTDSAVNTATGTITITVGTTLILAGIDPISGKLKLPPAQIGSSYTAKLGGYGGTAPYTFSVTSGSLPAGLTLSNGVISGTPTAAGNPTCTIQVADSASHTASASVAMNVAAADTATRPAGNTGSGFFVANGKLYDPAGHRFYIRGINRNHYDGATWTGGANGALTGCNTVRLWTYNVGSTAGYNAASVFIDALTNQSISNNILPILTVMNVPNTGTATSGDTSSTDLSSVVSWWVSNVSAFTPYMSQMAINVANEWGPAGSVAWQSAYNSAVSQLRGAGYTCPIVIDAGGSGQDWQGIISYAANIQTTDPQHNCIFSYHAYGSVDRRSAPISAITKANPAVITLNYLDASPNIHPFSYSASSPYTGIAPNNNTWNGVTSYQITGVAGMTQINGVQACSQNNLGGVQGSSAWTVTLSVDSTNFGAYTSGGQIVAAANAQTSGHYGYIVSQLAALQSQGVCVIVGEFGPGRNIGPSPTLVSISELIGAAEANGLGWLYWAEDDHDNTNGASSNNWFGIANVPNNGAGYWTGAPSGLTEQGLDVVLNPRYGLKALPTAANLTPRITSSAFSYLGVFQLPNSWFGADLTNAPMSGTANYTAGGAAPNGLMYFNTNGPYSPWDKFAVAIPSRTAIANWATSMATASIIYGPSGVVTFPNYTGVPSDGLESNTGVMEYNGQLIYQQEHWYGNGQLYSHGKCSYDMTSITAMLAATGTVYGGSSSLRHVNQYSAPIPLAWQSAFGGTHFTGAGVEGTWQDSCAGYSAYSFKASDVVAGTSPFSITALMDSPGSGDPQFGWLTTPLGATQPANGWLNWDCASVSITSGSNQLTINSFSGTPAAGIITGAVGTGAVIATGSESNLTASGIPVGATLLSGPAGGGVGTYTLSQNATATVTNGWCAIGTNDNGVCRPTDKLQGAFFPSNTRSVVFVALHGYGALSYKSPNDNGGGWGATPYGPIALFYDANDLVSAKNGSIKPYAPYPYSVWQITGGADFPTTFNYTGTLFGAGYLDAPNDGGSSLFFLATPWKDGTQFQTFVHVWTVKH